MEIISRKDARNLGLRLYFTGKPCKHGHVEERRVDNNRCVQCARDSQKRQRDSNPEEYNRKRRARRKKNLDKYRETDRKWYSTNTDKILEKKSSWRDENRNLVREITRKSKKKNKHKVYANNAQRRADKIDRTLAFSDEYLKELNSFVIEETYNNSIDLKDSTGVCHAVDHIVPLKGLFVSGLHVWYNLQILEKSENDVKSNSFVPYWENHVTGDIKFIEEDICQTLD